MKFGTDGVRGAANTELTVDFALNLGRAAAQVLSRLGDDSDDSNDSGSIDRTPRAIVVLGGDTRESTPMFRAALGAGFCMRWVMHQICRWRVP